VADKTASAVTSTYAIEKGFLKKYTSKQAHYKAQLFQEGLLTATYILKQTIHCFYKEKKNVYIHGQKTL